MVREGSLPITDKQIIIHGMVYDLTRKYPVGDTSLVDFPMYASSPCKSQCERALHMLEYMLMDLLQLSIRG